MSPRVVLVGLPGTGKTTVGKRLAARLGVAFTDSDELVESRAGCSVAEIFAADGEAAFREAEAAAIATALRDYDGVLALGGGAVLAAATREALASSGVPVVLLHAKITTLTHRVGTGETRPLLAGDPPGRLVRLAAEREPLYRQVATHLVETDQGSPDQVAATIETRVAAGDRSDCATVGTPEVARSQRGHAGR